MTCCNANGWIVQDGMVVDRCQRCNPTPRRKVDWVDRNWRWVFPLGFLSGIAVCELAGLFAAKSFHLI